MTSIENIVSSLPFAFFICEWKNNKGEIIAKGGGSLEDIIKLAYGSFFQNYTIEDIFPKIPWKILLNKLPINGDAYYTEQYKDRWVFTKVVKTADNQLSVLCMDYPNVYMNHFLKNIITKIIKTVFDDFHNPTCLIDKKRRIIYNNQHCKQNQLENAKNLNLSEIWDDIITQHRKGLPYVLKNKYGSFVLFPIIAENIEIGVLVISEADSQSISGLLGKIKSFTRSLYQTVLADSEPFEAFFKDYFIIRNEYDQNRTFYWFTSQFDNYLIALIDTNQYGLKGAYMSVLIHNALTHIVNEKLNFYPSDIIKELYKTLKDFVKSALQFSGEDDPENIDSIRIGFLTLTKKFTHYRFGSNGIDFILKTKEKTEIISAPPLNFEEDINQQKTRECKDKLTPDSLLIILNPAMFENEDQKQEFLKIIADYNVEKDLYPLRTEIENFLQESNIRDNNNIDIIAIKL